MTGVRLTIADSGRLNAVLLITQFTVLLPFRKSAAAREDDIYMRTATKRGAR